MTQRQFTHYVDAVRYRRHNDRKFAYLIAGGDEAEWPDYESAVEAQPSNEEIEAMLASASYVRRVPEPPPES